LLTYPKLLLINERKKRKNLMKKLLVPVLLFSFFTLLYSNTDVPIGSPLFKVPPRDRRLKLDSQSFMFTRPIYQNIAAQMAGDWVDLEYEKIGCLGFSAQVIPLYQHSIHSKDPAQYFLLNQKTSLVFKGDGTPDPELRDVRAEWFGLPNDFVGTFSVMPKQKQFGVWFEFNKDLATFSCNEYFKSLWVAIAFPFQSVENNLQPGELLVSGRATTFPHDIIEALNQTTYRYAKIRDHKKRKSALAELYFKLGTTFMNRDGFIIGLYSMLVMPTYGHQDPEYTFNPFLGHNRHFGFGTGVNFQLPLNSDIHCRLISLFFNIENLYFLRNYQKRTLDLCFKPWSRYLLFNKIDGTTNIPGVNVLTRKVKVNPFNFVDLTAGFRLQTGWVEAEIGYDLWAHGDEQIKLKKPFPKDMYGIAGNAAGTTASKSTIEKLAPDDADFVAITEFDINRLTGSARAATVHRAHLAFGATHDQCSFILSWNLGGFIEIPQEDTALKNWGVWGKVAGTF
jgi:hypothetical protein